MKGMRMKKTNRRYGFTIIELLVVVSIMAVIATLATGAAMKTLKQTREKRISATIKALEAGLVNYRALNGEWPFKIADTTSNDTFITIKNEDAFEKVFEKVRKGQALLDPAALLTRIGGRRMSAREAMEKGNNRIPIGYPDPANTDTFILYTVKYNTLTDSVTISK